MTIVFDDSLDVVVKLIKMFYFKFHNIHLNKVLETSVIKVFCYLLIELIYNIIAYKVIIYYLKV